MEITLSAQLHLFAAHSPQKPLGIKIRWLRPCVKCGSTVGATGPGKGPHVAELRCVRCGAHYRWLSERERRIAIRRALSPHAPEVIVLPPRGSNHEQP
jgi:hypothetical protein